MTLNDSHKTVATMELLVACGYAISAMEMARGLIEVVDDPIDLSLQSGINRLAKSLDKFIGEPIQSPHIAYRSDDPQ